MRSISIFLSGITAAGIRILSHRFADTVQHLLRSVVKQSNLYIQAQHLGTNTKDRKDVIADVMVGITEVEVHLAVDIFLLCLQIIIPMMKTQSTDAVAVSIGKNSKTNEDFRKSIERRVPG